MMRGFVLLLVAACGHPVLFTGEHTIKITAGEPPPAPSPGGTSNHRDPATYRADTRRVLESRIPQINACYAHALADDPTAKGTVTVKFTVAGKTGAVTGLAVDRDHSSAAEPVRQCVIDSLAGLALSPADRNEGHATFVFELYPHSG